MGLRYSNYTYDNLANDQVKFLQGTEAELALYLPNSTDTAKRGAALEGAFYLTTDTHRLYIGRKVTTEGADYGKVFPEEVSSGITTVANAGALGAAAVQAKIGDFYYVLEGNILAVYEGPGEGWQQINSPSGIASINTAAQTSNGTVSTTISVNATGGGTDGYLHFVEGDNITLTSSNTAADANNPAIANITIAAKDTTYAVGTAAPPSGTDKAILGLKKDGGSTLEATKVEISGANTVKVTSDSSNNITVTGPSFTGIGVAAYSTDGFELSLQGTDGYGTALSVTGDLKPSIKYGQSTPKTEAKFASGSAVLDIYTKSETDTAISNAITSQLAGANAMTYMGTVNSETDLRSKIVANGAHKGDIYKVVLTGSNTININGVDAATGDLIILDGTENSDGIITIGGNVITTSTPTSTICNNICTLVPSGDEQVVTATVAAGSNSANGGTIQLLDSKNNISGVNILKTDVVGSDKILVQIANTTSSDTDINGNGTAGVLTVRHDTTNRTYNATSNPNGDKNDLTLSTSSSTDTIGQNKVSFFVLSDTTGLKTDSYGHVTGIQGTKLTFTHNRVTNYITSYGTSSSSGLIEIQSGDTIGSTATASFKLTSSTLTLSGTQDNNTPANSNLAIDLVWGNFN